MRKLILLLALLVPAAACASARAEVRPAEHPALDVPPVPPRQIGPLPVDPPPLELVAEVPPDIPAVAPPRARPVREPNNRADPKTEAKAPETPTEPVAPPVPPLREGTQDSRAVERQVRDTLERANKMLGGVNPDALNEERRANYNYAKSFIKQAEEEIKAANLTSAKSLADRAETIAKLLTGGDEDA